MGTVFAVVALLLAVIAFGYAWLLRQDLEKAIRRLDRYNRALYDANEEIRQLREETVEKLAQLQAGIARGAGNAVFRPDMTIREVYALHPQAQEILASYHLGGCSSCAVSPDDRLDRVCQASGLPTQDVLANLNALFGNSNGRATEVQRVKLPNIELSL